MKPRLKPSSEDSSSRALPTENAAHYDIGVERKGYQAAGFSRPLANWILMKANEIEALALLEKTFAGGRPSAFRKHLRWDFLFIEVQRAD
jgi:hypothetical protein